MTTRITLYDGIAKQKHTQEFGSDIPAILYAQSKLASLDTRWTKFKAEDVETGLVLAGPCTLAEMNELAAAKVGEASSFEDVVSIVGPDIAKLAVETFGADAEARLVEAGVPADVAAEVHAQARARLGIEVDPPVGLDITAAEEVAGQIRAAYQRISDVSWLLDTGLSDLRKTKAGGRNETQAEAHPFTRASEDDVARRLARAEAILKQLNIVGLA